MIGDKDGRFLSRSGKPFKPGATQKIDTGAGMEDVAISPAIFVFSNASLKLLSIKI